MADITSILNYIRQEGGAEFTARVPLATRTNLTAVGDAILSLGTTTEKFLNVLVNRIALTIVQNKTFKNPLSVLKKGGIPLGDHVQEIYTNMAKANTYDPTGANLLSRSLPDVKQIFHSLNRQDQYKVTISKPQLKQAFVSFAEFEKFLNGIVTSLYSGDNRDEFVLTKNLIASAITGGKIVTVQTPDINTADGAKQLVKSVKNISSLFTFPSDQFNKYKDISGEATGVETWTPKEDQLIIMRSDILTEIDLNVLSVAFHMEKTSIEQMTLAVDNFGSASGGDAGTFEPYLMLTDRSAFQVYDNDFGMENFYNPEGRYWNYYLNHWQTYGISLFANAVVIGAQH